MGILKPKILLVDDDSAVLESHVRALSDYAPLRAADGLEARDILSAHEVDIVLCDLEMPRMSGLELMQWAHEHCPHPLWILVSGRGTFDTAAQALKLGAFDFICKPIQSPFQLRTAVANAARHQALARSLADNDLALRESLAKLEVANRTLTEQRAILDQDLQRGESILRALLPSALLPIDHLQVNVAYRPSKSIGGDFYGAAMLDERHLAVYVADVAGHGVSAALLAVLFHQRLSAFNVVPQSSPASVLSDMNRALREECRVSGLFVTVVYALIDTVARTATIASAGHPPGILLRAGGHCEHIEHTGPAVGLGPGARYEDLRVALHEGDRLLLYTDGVADALSARRQTLDASFASAASVVTDGSAVVDRLLASTEPDRQADDDRTLLLVTAGSGASTFDTGRAERRRSARSDCPLWIGTAAGQTWVVIRGQATWKDAAVLHDTCIDALEEGGRVVVDLEACSLLDSTVLGTLHEVVVRAPAGWAQLQAVSESVRHMFAELAMTQVLAAIKPSAEPVPQALQKLQSGNVDEAAGTVLHAHELLAGLSASNAAQFGPVVEALQQGE